MNYLWAKDKNKTDVFNEIDVRIPTVSDVELMHPKDPKVVLKNALKFRNLLEIH